jgi:putative ABC transport system substrate-binding protein
MFLVATTFGFSILALRPRAQTSNRIVRVGIVTPFTGEPGPADVFWAVLRRRLHERGWVEGKNIIFEHRDTGGFARLPSEVNEMVALNVDVILTAGAPAALAAKKATDRIPIVFWADDPVGRGIVASLAQPWGNATGIARQGTEMFAKRIELLRQVLPGISRVAVLENPIPGTPPALQQRIPHGIEVFAVSLRNADDLEPAFAMIAMRQADAVLVGESIWQFRTEILEGLTKLRLPAVFWDDEWVKSGGLLAFGPDNVLLMHQVVIYIDKILRGAKPADLPVEQPMAFDLAINLKTAKSLGITVPRDLLVRANWIVE